MNYAENIQPYLRKDRGIFQQHLFVGTSNPYEGAEVNVLQVVVTRGLQASGKSTWAKILAEHWYEQFGNKVHPWVRICKDDIRLMMGEYWVLDREEYINDCVKSMIYGALMNGYCVVFDGLGLKEETLELINHVCMDAARDRWFIKNIRCKVELFYKDFHTSIDQCIINDKLGFKNGRRIYIGEDVIRETAEKYKDVLAGLQCNRAPYEVCNWSYYNED